MRRETAVAQILLILSVANFALAAPAVVQQRHLNRDILAPESPDDSPPKSPPGLSHHDWVPEPRMDSSSSSSSPAVSYEYGPWALVHNYLAHPVPSWDQDSVLNPDSAPASLSGSVKSLPESVPSAHGDPAPEPEDPPLHHDSAPESPASDSAMTPEAGRFFNDGLKQKIKVLGVVFGAVGAVYGINQIKDKVSSRAYVSPLPSLSCQRQTESQTF
jgi:hypothetical protein